MRAAECDSENIEDLKRCMKLNDILPINVFKLNDSYIVGIYKGSISKYDILIKYRQKEKGVWSRIRTPKHIHWVVDMLLKMQMNQKKS